MTFKTLLAGIALFTLSACASVPGQYDFADTTSPEGHLFADYLIGSYAGHLEDAAARSKYYTRAFEQAPEDVILGRRAATSAVRAGDMPLARNLAKKVLEKEPFEPMSRAILGADAFAKGQSEKAEAYFETSTNDLTSQVLMNIMRGWNKAALGSPEDARSIFSSVGGGFAAIGGGQYFDLLGRLQVATLDAATGDFDAATNGFDLIEASNFAPLETALAKVRALSLTGDVDAACDYLEAFAKEHGGFETGPIRFYTDSLQAGKPVSKKLTPQQEAARAITETSYGFFVRNGASDAGEVFLRVALELDPNHDKAKLWLGSLLENSKREDEAMALFMAIPDNSPYIVSARLSQASLYFSRKEDEKALALLEKTNAEHTSLVTRESLGRARLIRENYAEALPIYDALVKSMSEEKIAENPEPLYFRGICYERLKQWDEAVADFKRVLEVDPDNADALNYLGYTWVDRNENLDEAFSMIRKAVALEPESGAIVDSLGWAHYKLGQYEEARVQLEKAVELSPSSATIIDHLGDTYWKLGRFREAGYQWTRALEFDPTDEERETIAAKLDSGKGPVEALP
ncbi:MAG: tetratricopeptide repeat protein [Alphaproteobacteria bacterium]